MVVALLYEMQTPCNCSTLSLCVSDSCRSNSWRDDHNAMMEINKPVMMEIMTMLSDDDGHIMSHILIACDVYLLCILFSLVRW